MSEGRSPATAADLPLLDRRMRGVPRVKHLRLLATLRATRCLAGYEITAMRLQSFRVCIRNYRVLSILVQNVTSPRQFKQLLAHLILGP